MSVLCFQKTVLLVVSVFKVLFCTWKSSFLLVNHALIDTNALISFSLLNVSTAV